MVKNQYLEKLQKFTQEVEKLISPAFITTDPYEIEASSGDLSLLPKYHYKFKEEYLATHIIRPKDKEELSKIMKLCRDYSFPVTIRAAGTSCFSASTPTKGGVIIDTRRMNRILKIDNEKLIVSCEAGISWVKLIETLLNYGLTPKCYPTSYKSSCVCGFIATSGKAGIGILKYGIMEDTLLSVTIVKPDGSIETVSKNSQGDLTLEDITGSNGIFGAIAEVEMSVTALQTSMQMIGYSFKSFSNAFEYFLTLKNYSEVRPLFLSLSDKKFEQLSHKIIPSRDYFVYAVYYDDTNQTNKAFSFAKEAAAKIDGLYVEEWYLKEKWDDIADTELNLARICKNPIFQEYWISDERVDAFYKFYSKKIREIEYRNAFYMMAGGEGRNRIKLFGLSDIDNSREFFAIKANFNDITNESYANHDSLYTIGVVNTFYFLQFNPEDVKSIKIKKYKLDPNELVNSYRFIRAKMKFWRIKLLFKVAKFLFKIV
ncbi:FAD-binding oxidoreductase [Candidatus Harpocratesius sp.]